jgi:hypothetical protein
MTSEAEAARKRLTVAIMQPYFFPYLGYFQLAAKSDIFVFHDDAQYIKGGWVNRNRIARDGKESWLTLPVLRGAHDLAINERRYQLTPRVVDRLLRRIGAAYADAPRFEQTRALVGEILNCGDANVATFNARLVQRVAGQLGIRASFVFSSQLGKDNRLTGQERVIDICRRLGATDYVNPIGGTRLYQAERFSREGIDLSFLESTVASCRPSEDPPIAPLSIIDALMFNGDDVMAALLKQCRRRPGEGASGATPGDV